MYLVFSKKSILTSRWPFFFNFFTKKLKKVKKVKKKYFQHFLMYRTKVQTQNCRLESKAILISIQTSTAIQDLLDYMPLANIPAQLKILIPQCLLTLVGMRSKFTKTYCYLQWATNHFKHLFRTQWHPQAHIKHIPLIPISFCSLLPPTATRLHSKVKHNLKLS